MYFGFHTILVCWNIISSFCKLSLLKLQKNGSECLMSWDDTLWGQRSRSRRPSSRGRRMSAVGMALLFRTSAHLWAAMWRLEREFHLNVWALPQNTDPESSRHSNCLLLLKLNTFQPIFWNVIMVFIISVFQANIQYKWICFFIMGTQELFCIA